jgi:hypothetical protein
MRLRVRLFDWELNGSDHDIGSRFSTYFSAKEKNCGYCRSFI